MSKQNSARYLIGIDLGTTHSVLSYIDCQADTVERQILDIPQLTNPGAIGSAQQLPSFLYSHHESEISAQELTLPWAQSPQVLGQLARSMGAKTPIRLVSSAKSWLCHGGIDRKAPLLPLDAPDEVTKVSAFETSCAYLQHLSNAWDQQFPEHPIAEQCLVLTIPASFDPAARELTAEAARTVGLHNLSLLEEPQAAVYSWIHANENQWREQLTVGDIVLVVDVGGGTTDLSLVAVTQENGNLQLNRVAVGDHILLGGDNMDLALAYQINAKLAETGKQLQPWQIQALTHACRDAKEVLLSDSEQLSVPITVPSRGSKLLGATLRSELTRNEVEQTIIEGFFPRVPIEEKPTTHTRSALTQKGLPYAQDAGITRHLASFLSRQHSAADQLPGFNNSSTAQSNHEFIKPTALLLNGGVLKASLLQTRLCEVINEWLTHSNADEARLLHGNSLDLSVAQGAAYFAYATQPNAKGDNTGVRIHGGTASTYYVGIESSMPAVPGMPPPIQALCLAPFGMEEGSSIRLNEQEFGLVVGEPVSFKFFGSNSRREDPSGTLLSFWQEGELENLPDIQATLSAERHKPGEVVSVYLQASVTTVGTLKLEAIEKDGPSVWDVELTVRDAD